MTWLKTTSLFLETLSFTLLMFFNSCKDSSSAEKSLNQGNESETRVEIKRNNNGEKVAQYLITAEEDTVHTILYNNGEIIKNEGSYVFGEITALKGDTNTVLIDFYAVRFDSLSNLFSIQEFINDSLGYQHTAAEEMDSYKHSGKYKTNKDIIDIAIGVAYYDTVFGEILNHSYMRPLIIDFKEGTINEKPPPINHK